MNEEIERIDLEIESIAILTKKLILEADINLGLLSELVQVTDRRISELVYMKDHIMAWGEPEDKILNLKISAKELIFIRSKTDNDWMKIHNLKLLENGQIFTTKTERKEGKEYRLISQEFCTYESPGDFFRIKVEKVKG